MSADEPLEVRRTGRFGIVLAGVLTRPDLSPMARLVYAGLTLYAGGTGQAWPTATTLAASLGMARSTTYTALDELAAAGIITRQRRHTAAGADRSTLITLVDEAAGSVRQPDTGSVREPDTSVREPDTTSVREPDTNKDQRTTTRARAREALPAPSPSTPAYQPVDTQALYRARGEARRVDHHSHAGRAREALTRARGDR